MEVWKDIEGYEGIYQVSNTGKVRSLDRKVWNYIKKGRVLKPHNNGHGYYNVSLHDNKKIEKHAYIHILVAKAFIPNPHNYEQVNHKDFDKSNNNVDNLEWVSREQNISHYRKSKYCKKCEKKVKKYFVSKTIKRIYESKDKIINLYNSGKTIKQIAEETKIGKDTIYDILKLFNVL